MESRKLFSPCSRIENPFDRKILITIPLFHAEKGRERSTTLRSNCSRFVSILRENLANSLARFLLLALRVTDLERIYDFIILAGAIRPCLIEFGPLVCPQSKRRREKGKQRGKKKGKLEGKHAKTCRFRGVLLTTGYIEPNVLAL